MSEIPQKSGCHKAGNQPRKIPDEKSATGWAAGMGEAPHTASLENGKALAQETLHNEVVKIQIFLRYTINCLANHHQKSQQSEASSCVRTGKTANL